MIGFKNPSREAEYREATAKCGSIGSTHRNCERCGGRFPIYEMRKRRQRSTRLSPTRWYCRECFDHVR